MSNYITSNRTMATNFVSILTKNRTTICPWTHLWPSGNPTWTLAQESGPDGHKYLLKDDKSSLEPWNIGYVASGGFLAPAFAGDNVATWSPPEDDEVDSEGKKKKKTPSAFWLDATQARELEPHLHPDVVGGWWFPEDASVDARRLTCSLTVSYTHLTLPTKA